MPSTWPEAYGKIVLLDHRVRVAYCKLILGVVLAMSIPVKLSVRRPDTHLR
jgi:hypothetical protein